MSGDSVSKADLEQAVETLLRAAGYQPSHARQTAELLVWADMRGTRSHGVMRVPRYVEMIGQGMIRPDAEPAFQQHSASTGMVDAGLAPAAPGLNLAVDNLVRMAGASDIALCSVRQSSHSGAIGYFAQKIAAAGLIGIVMSASKPLMAYTGTRGAAVSTNPLAIAAPMRGGEVIALDMSTAAVALGKVMAARNAQEAIPEGWGLDGAGKATTDPSAVETLLPMAGPKGAGLSLMIEVLTSLLVGNPLIGPALGGEEAEGFNATLIALRPALFVDQNAFEAQLEALATALRAAPRADGVDRIYLPGERGTLRARQAESEGIELIPATRKALADAARSLGCALPAGLQQIAQAPAAP